MSRTQNRTLRTRRSRSRPRLMRQRKRSRMQCHVRSHFWIVIFRLCTFSVAARTFLRFISLIFLLVLRILRQRQLFDSWTCLICLSLYSVHRRIVSRGYYLFCLGILYVSRAKENVIWMLPKLFCKSRYECSPNIRFAAVTL